MRVHVKLDGQTPMDRRRCFISGSQVLPDGRLVICDSYNKCVKLFNTSHTMITQVELAGYPWDIAVVSESEVIVIVNMASSRLMQFVTVTDVSLILGHSFQTDNIYRQVDYCDNQLFVTEDTGRESIIKVLDMTGRTLKTLDKYREDPRYIVVNKTERVIYASNPNKGTVTCLTMDGDPITVYNHGYKAHHEHLGLTVHPNGSVYVLGWWTSCVYHITSQCTHIETLLDQGQLSYPNGMCCSPAGDTFYVSESDHSELKVCKIDN